MFQIRDRLTNCLIAGALASGALLPVPAAEAASEMVLHAFGNFSDGRQPSDSLIDIGGTLYGTTAQGGGTTSCPIDSSCGTVFQVNRTTGAETVVYAFQGGTDGAAPEAGLINVGGILYGTTSGGGAHGYYGTVFKVIPATGAETVVYSFCSQTSCSDGAYPSARLISVGATLYGTTQSGGVPFGCSGYGCGTVFKVDPATGTETVVHSFTGGSDGASPYAGLINVGGTLYGTTVEGGTTGTGTVFSISLKTGAETVLYAFKVAPSRAETMAPTQQPA